MDCCWPEQDALDKWREEAGLENLPNWYELKKAVTAHRLEVQKELETAKKRISELCEMLNKAQDVAKVQIENERDGCERAVQFLLDVAEGKEPDSEKASGERIRALRHAVDVLKSRKDPGVKAVHEVAHGSMVGEYVQARIDEAVEQVKAHYEGEQEDDKAPTNH